MKAAHPTLSCGSGGTCGVGGASLEPGRGLCPFNNTLSKTEGMYLPSLCPVLREKETAAEFCSRYYPEAPPQIPSPYSPPRSSILCLPNMPAGLLTCSALSQVGFGGGGCLQASHIRSSPHPPKFTPTTCGDRQLTFTEHRGWTEHGSTP